MASPNEILSSAMLHHRTGDFQTAERLYQEILKQDPQNVDALHLLGVIAYQVGKHEQAIELIRCAITINSSSPVFHCNLGSAYRALGKLDDAINCYQQALQLKPNYTDAHSNLGIALKDRGRLVEAIDSYRQAIDCNPGSAEAYYNLAIALSQRGQLNEAIASYRRAIEIKPGYVEAHCNLGVALHRLDRTEEAIDSFQQALGIDSNHAEAHRNLGVALQSLGRSNEAIACYQTAAQLKPDHPELLHQLGSALLDQGKLDEASVAYRRALEIQPEFAEAHCNLGNVLQEQRKLTEAIACYQKALELRPEFPEAYVNLGIARRRQGNHDEAILALLRACELKPSDARSRDELGVALLENGQLDEAISSFRTALRGEANSAEVYCHLGIAFQLLSRYDEAEASYREAIKARPDFAEAYSNLGVTLRDQGRWYDAIAAYQAALRYKPDSCEALTNLGDAHREQGNLAAAVTFCEQAVRINPGSSHVHRNLANAFKEHGQLEAAAASFRQSLQCDPGSAGTLSSLIHLEQQICQWDGLSEDVTRLKVAAAAGDRDISPFVFLGLPTSPAEQHCCARQAIAGLKLASRSFGFQREKKCHLTLGYLSGNFRDHPGAVLAVELFERHDRAQFNVIAYSFGRDDGSPMRRRLHDAFDQFVDIRDLPFERAAQRIHEDGVDVLIDLMGFTNGAWIQILSMRPAPIQVNFLGFPGTMGADFMDYIVVDEFVVPADQQPHFTERLVHLPCCYQPNDSRRPITHPPPSRSQCDLPEKGFVFCCFNQSFKITPEVFRIWLRLLTQVPGSVLWLLESNRLAVSNLRREAESSCVDPNRLVFAKKVALPEHLARTSNADLFLDTWPYNAHTTASNALWAGCPVLTFAGQTFPSRVAGSLLKALGVPELITASPEEYEQLALELARDRRRLAAIRCQLAEGRERSGLFDGKQFARCLERAYLRMWEVYLAGDPPLSFSVV